MVPGHLELTAGTEADEERAAKASAQSGLVCGVIIPIFKDFPSNALNVRSS